MSSVISKNDTRYNHLIGAQKEARGKRTAHRQTNKSHHPVPKYLRCILSTCFTQTEGESRRHNMTNVLFMIK